MTELTEDRYENMALNENHSNINLMPNTVLYN